MKVTVKKQVEEQVEFHTPAYYRGQYGHYCHINEQGVLTVVRPTMICLWKPEQGTYYESEINALLATGTECTQAEFMNAYDRTLATIHAAVLGVDTATVTEMPS